MATIGLVISTYNWPEALERVLDSALAQSTPPTEILVADDGSGPETAALVRRFAERAGFPIIHVWQEDRGYRLARIRNQAIARASADYLVFLDGDQVLHRHFVRDHLAAARPNTVLRGSRVFLTPAATAQVLDTGRVPRWWSPGLRKRAAALRVPPLAWLLGAWRGRGTQGHNLACWRADAVRVNGFEERFEGWGGEDADFVIRLLNAGVRKRRLRFAGVLFHLDHPPASRTRQASNDRIYDETVATGRIRAEVGLDQAKSVP